MIGFFFLKLIIFCFVVLLSLRSLCCCPVRDEKGVDPDGAGVGGKRIIRVCHVAKTLLFNKRKKKEIGKMAKKHSVLIN